MRPSFDIENAVEETLETNIINANTLLSGSFALEALLIDVHCEKLYINV